MFLFLVVCSVCLVQDLLIRDVRAKFIFQKQSFQQTKMAKTFLLLSLLPTPTTPTQTSSKPIKIKTINKKIYTTTYDNNNNGITRITGTPDPKSLENVIPTQYKMLKEKNLFPETPKPLFDKIKNAFQFVKENVFLYDKELSDDDFTLKADVFEKMNFDEWENHLKMKNEKEKWLFRNIWKSFVLGFGGLLMNSVYYSLGSVIGISGFVLFCVFYDLVRRFLYLNVFLRFQKKPKSVSVKSNKIDKDYNRQNQKVFQQQYEYKNKNNLNLQQKEQQIIIPDEKCDILVVGAGVTGLACAYELNKRGKDVLVIESENYVGGNAISTEVFDKQNNIQPKRKYLLEEGVNSCRPTENIMKICEELNIKMLFGDPDAPRFVYVKNKLRKLPGSFKEVLFGDYLSFFGKLTLFFKLLGFKSNKIDKQPETLKQFAVRNFGSEFYENLLLPFVNGTSAGDPEMIGVKSALQFVYDLEDEKVGGSIVGGLVWHVIGKIYEKYWLKKYQNKQQQQQQMNNNNFDNVNENVGVNDNSNKYNLK